MLTTKLEERDYTIDQMTQHTSLHKRQIADLKDLAIEKDKKIAEMMSTLKEAEGFLTVERGNHSDLQTSFKRQSMSIDEAKALIRQKTESYERLQRSKEDLKQ